jgi:hypothetical protein
MADFNIRSESVDVEQIMKQIRARIREKRGVDYTEEQIRELATVRLEKFLDPKNLRSDLLEQFRRSRPAIAAEPPPVEAPYEFGDQTLFETHRAPLRFIRKLLNPLLKLLFNPNPLINVLHTQAQFNVDLLKREQRRKIEFDRSRAEWNSLYYEVLHNLVLETTRSSIEIKNLKMRVEALASRLDFSERRVRALEGVVQYRPEAVRPRSAGQNRPEAAADGASAIDAAEAGPQTGDGMRRRRRRRRGRRGSGAPAGAVAPPEADQHGAAEERVESTNGEDQSDALDVDAYGEEDADGIEIMDAAAYATADDGDDDAGPPDSTRSDSSDDQAPDADDEQ